MLEGWHVFPGHDLAKAGRVLIESLVGNLDLLLIKSNRLPVMLANHGASLTKLLRLHPGNS